MRRITDMPISKPKTKRDIVKFLSDHFRYPTMNNWNPINSYAVNVKILHLNLTREERDRCYDILSLDDCWSVTGVQNILSGFDEAYDYRYQIGSDGRIGGYLVLYQGGKKPSGHKSFCTMCGQRSYASVFELPDNPTSDLKDRLDIVWDFDATCESACASFLDFALHHEVVEKEIMAPKIVRVPVEK